ncbi:MULTISPECIES: tRNA lysidine(34) synthetase TilS [Allobacillus]|uniref:tRNA(Ile)-lysidine synthase n=1 Tax=Allobacillus salarius TaxID=1955272 RepID=A0A556P6V6_9BACI|nr:tRNA lysidine(34) synthetase TilS [Allobacillus salarius]TSJ60114.1 tRNA lysidine(34) synthetase TilS [Allobacillus salarius]
MLLQTILTFNQKHQLFQQNDTLYLAVSGGPDSMAMLDFFYRIKDAWSLDLYVLTVDHQLRGEDSRQDVELVEKEAAKRDIPFIEGKVNVKAYQRVHQIGTQEAARTLRYDFFQQQMQGKEKAKLVTAHHADDQAETMFMQLAKGVRPKGIPVHGQFGDIQLIRPFLCVSKQALISYATEKEIPYHQDPSNEEDTYTRNRFRKYVLPFFKGENPKLLEGVQRVAEIQRDEDAVLDKLTEEKMCDFTQFYEQKVTFSIDGFLALPLPLQRRGFHLILNYLQVPIGKKDYFFDFLEWIQAEKPNATYSFQKDYSWIKSYGQCVIQKNERFNSSFSEEIQLNDTRHLPNGWSVTVEETEANTSELTNANVFVCDRRLIEFPLHIRTRKPGDRIRILGLAGSKKVKDIFIDKKIPANDRDSWPIVVNGDGEILWLPLLARSELGTLSDQVTSYVVIRVNHQKKN